MMSVSFMRSRDCSPLFRTFYHRNLIIHHILRNCNRNFSQITNFSKKIFEPNDSLSPVFGRLCNFSRPAGNEFVICKFFVNRFDNSNSDFPDCTANHFLQIGYNKVTAVFTCQNYYTTIYSIRQYFLHTKPQFF